MGGNMPAQGIYIKVKRFVNNELIQTNRLHFQAGIHRWEILLLKFVFCANMHCM